MKTQRVNAFLTFNGKAEEAMKFYEANVPGAKITNLIRYGEGHPMIDIGEENIVLFGSLNLHGEEIMFMDMAAKYPAPEFSWATSIFVYCADEAEFDATFSALANGGNVMMGPEPVAHFRKCAWVTDKFGVTWQPVWE